MNQTTKPLVPSPTFVTDRFSAAQRSSSVWRVATFMLVCTVLVLLTATRTSAQVQVPNMEGETFQTADVKQSKVSCTSDIKGGNVNLKILM